jgi:L-aspartate oxidase
MNFETDFLVIGSGMAGLTFAINASKKGRVTLITKESLMDSNSNYAQGGIASVLSPYDSFESHIEDTIKAGAKLCKKDVVDFVIKKGPEVVEKLMKYGVSFSTHEDNLDLGKEGGHTSRRIAHAGDITGHEIMRVLVDKAGDNKNITIKEDHIAVDLISNKKLWLYNEPLTCYGAYVLNKSTGEVDAITSNISVLATGGAGKVYLYTSNPDVATGDGIAMAYRIGALIGNMEFVQFHPTCLYHPHAKSFLISEGLRGEGAQLILENGDQFIHKYDKRKELASRDVVARAIDNEMKVTGDDCVYLDITKKGKAFLETRFPNIYKTCLTFGIDMSKDPIPVVPAAHYLCGGIVTDINGSSSVKNLYAIGEVGFTGLHGANRLASNSLLEVLVISETSALSAMSNIDKRDSISANVPKWDPGSATDSDENVVVSHNWDEIRRFMWNYVGIVRTEKRLNRALKRIVFLLDEIDEYYWDFHVTPDLIELRNIATCAKLIIESALSRKESRGLHHVLDYPETDKGFERNTLLIKKGRNRIKFLDETK